MFCMKAQALTGINALLMLTAALYVSAIVQQLLHPTVGCAHACTWDSGSPAYSLWQSD